MPFLPGGLDDIIVSGEPSTDNRRLRKIAPGLSRGLRLSGNDQDDILGLDINEATGGVEELSEDVVSIILWIIFAGPNI